MKKALLVLTLGAVALIGCGAAGEAGESRAKKKPVAVAAAEKGEHPKSAYYRQRPTHARRFVGRRIGFYSYSYRDVINTYGMPRSLYGSINSYRDPYVDRQTPSGPFDHGFFFDSGNLPRGGNAPYMN